MARGRHYVLALLLTMVGLYACTDTSDRPFTDDEKRLIDSLYNFNIDSIRESLDSIRDTTYQQVYNHAVDSIMDQRIMEIKELLSTGG